MSRWQGKPWGSYYVYQLNVDIQAHALFDEYIITRQSSSSRMFSIWDIK